MTSHRVSDDSDTECVGPTVAELAEQWIAGRVARGELQGESPRVERNRIRSLLRLYGGRTVEVLDRAALLEWQASIGRWSPNTRKAYVGCIRRFCEWLVLEERLAADPAIALSKVRLPRAKPRNLRSGQVAQVIAAADEVASRRPQGGARQGAWTAIPAVMVGCGLRCIEVSRLDLDDYDRQKNLLFVRGKGGHERTVPVPAETVAALDRYLEVRGLQPGPLFLAVGSRASADRRISARWIGKKTARIMRTAGVHDPGDRRTAHALRHTFATDVLAASNDLLALQELMGHANLSTTQIYLGLAGEERLRLAVEGRRYGNARALPEHPSGVSLLADVPDPVMDAESVPGPLHRVSVPAGGFTTNRHGAALMPLMCPNCGPVERSSWDVYILVTGPGGPDLAAWCVCGDVIEAVCDLETALMLLSDDVGAAELDESCDLRPGETVKQTLIRWAAEDA